MKAQQLKNAILQLAIQGKLVPQDPNDEPASELLCKIQAEKDRLIVEGKIKKSKKSADKAPYTIEPPFEIPESWVWVRLGDIGEWGSGATPSRHEPKFYENGTIPWLKTGDLNDGIITEIPEYITPLAVEKSSVKLNPIGSVLIAMYGATIGKLGILNIEATTNQACCACIPYNGIYNKFLFYYLMSQKTEFQKCSEGSGQPNISKEKIVNYIYPLPPLEEQHRIVQKIEELLPLVECYAQTEQKLTKLNNTFPEQLKKSVLQAAIQGKLTEQLPTDEPASELLKRIETEKMRLISEGKLKKPRLRDNSQNAKFEPPFEIPQGWEWVRLGDLFEINPRNKLDGELTVSFIPMNLIEDGYKNAHTSQIRQWKEIKSGFTHFSENDLAVAKITPCFENRKSVIFQNLENKFGAGTTELFVFRSIGDIANINYLFWFVKSHHFINGGVKSYSGTAGQQRVSSDYIKNCLFPLSPLEEQKRIVEKVELLLSQIERL